MLLLLGKTKDSTAYGVGETARTPVIWLSFEFGIVPALRLIHPQRPRRARDRIASAVDHALHGLVLSEIRPAHKAMR